ncbi:MULTISPECIES: alpha/beta hydrolase-fold protein [Streptosporangium]|uniref:Enterochelin esterase-like enzyme n=1 Tax=Streptosporangium brasiliense TaxID=47480 RepID=A0ABT9R9U8_9ACTN|nr:alpha/beta hydrolase-fold protein [Streptosporangium brasiliense]MDP9865993.1 enterochelin esterase-like enzyme [Streptosporangium brasiliense]
MAVTRWRGLGVLTALALVALLAVPGQAQVGKERAGTITEGSAYSAAMGGPIPYNVYLPYGYGDGARRYPVLYLLHGRGDTMQAWTRVKGALDQLIRDGRIPALIAVMPDAPWSGRGSWYVDSRYTGADEPGRPVETALTRDLVGHVDSTYRTAPIRGARMVGGYSMGGYGALRLTLAHPDLFGGALVLSPAVYTPLPPADSSARDHGAFGLGEEKFVDEVYRKLNYPDLLAGTDPELPVRLFVAVGDDEYANPRPADARHDLDFESEALYNAARRAPGVSAQMRILDGGHDWSVWAPAFEQGMADLGPALSVVPPTGLPAPLYGTAGTDWAGGVAAQADGSVTLGLAAGGPVDGQPHAGKLDAVLIRRGPDGATRWTRQLGTASDERLYGVAALPDGGVLAAGYTKGDLDGRHPGNTTDDAFVARLDADGAVRWLTQFGAAGTADRVYGLAAAPDGGAYLAGYTKGALAGPNSGDKDAVLVRVAADGQITWTRQLGGAGEDKATGVAADGTGVSVVGSATAGLPGAPALGGLDGWIARYGTDGTPQWVSAEGGTGDDRLAAVTVTTDGLTVATGESGGDLLAVAYTSGNRRKWRTVVATAAPDAGAAVVALPGGAVEVIGYTRGRIGVAAGGADVLAVRLSAGGVRQAAAQFGTARDDGVDPFAEPDLYATSAPAGKVLVAGLTYGAPTGGAALGNGDLFLAAVDPATGLP